jgi:hypothetical protein
MQLMGRAKIFIGPLEIANVAKTLADAFRTQKIKADFYTYSNSLHPFQYKTEKILFLDNKSPVKGLNRLLRLYYFIKLFFKHNTFIFLSPESILSKNFDLPILKFFRKKIIFIFTGCAERDPLFQPNNPDFICNRCEDLSWQAMFRCNEQNIKRKKVEKFEKYSTFIISQPDSAAYLSKKKVIWFYIPVEHPPAQNYLSKFEQDKIVISHLPSNPLVKQTHIIVPVLNRIASEFDVEIIIKNGIWERDKILSVLDKTHILVDALGLGYATLAIEGMSRGCVIMNSFENWFKINVPDAPIYGTGSKTLYNDLVNLLNNRALQLEYSKRSIEYYNKYHTPEAVGEFYKSKLELI